MVFSPLEISPPNLLVCEFQVYTMAAENGHFQQEANAETAEMKR